MGTNGSTPEAISLVIDGKRVSVPKGTTIMNAAKAAGIEIPFYCYHPHLSIVGNCRICQVKVTGQPKLLVACHAQVAEGMEVFTHNTSDEVKDAQASTLEMILINHPLDCTVCDRAGHCKLQDYHYDYNARPSRFIEEKVHKVKAEPLGPHVILDGERCIMCTRCIRFCDEITETSELGMLNRGDRSMIAINPGKVLDNALSGTVVDLCPVGALTHRDWRFNTRMWFTKQTDSICPGCSTGCNVKVASRDGEIVQVKARLNSEVNKEWLCDEGRYGFNRFLPKNRVVASTVGGKTATLDAALTEAAKIKSGRTAIFVTTDLLLEEYTLLKNFIEKSLKDSAVALSYRERPLTKVEAILVSPDYAANFRGAEISGLKHKVLEAEYDSLLKEFREGRFSNVLLIGDRAILERDLDLSLRAAISKCAHSVGMLCDAESDLSSMVKVLLPARSILEKSGLLVNRQGRIQYSDKVINFPEGSEPEWRLINKLAEKCGGKLTDAVTDRDLTLSVLTNSTQFKGLRISSVKGGGVALL